MEQTVQLDYKMQYEELIAENQLDPKTFPAAIGKKIRTLKMLVGRYEKQPAESRKEQIIKEDIMTTNLIADWLEQGLPDAIVDPHPTPEKFDDELEDGGQTAAPAEGGTEGGEGTPAPSAEGTPTAQPAEGGEGTPAAAEANPPAQPAEGGAEGGEGNPAAAAAEATPPAQPAEGGEGTPAPAAEETPPAELSDDEKIAAMEKAIMEHRQGNRIKVKTLEQIIGFNPTEKNMAVGKINLRRIFLGDAYEII